VSGTIGAAANNDAPHVGVTWRVQLMGCKFLGANGGITAGAIAAIEYATTNGAAIMNNSWGGGPFSSALYDTIAAARQAGILFVVAAGNDAEDNDVIPHYPANYELDNIVSVAALTRADQLASFSDWGEKTVHLGAPGQDIYSSISISDSAYDIWAGTSMAAPHVTGVAALVRSYYPGISLAELRERLLQTVVPIPALNGITTTGGRVNAYKALSAAGDGELEVSLTPPPEGVLLNGSTQQIYAVVTDLFAITNATVRGTWMFGMSGNLNFANNGAPPDQQAGDATYSGQFIVATNVTEVRLQIIATAPGKAGYTNVFRWFVTLPPTNDDFADALKLAREGGVFYSNNKFGTFELPYEPFHANVPTVDATLWWSWSPEFDNRAIVDTAGSEFDTVVGVYTNRPLDRVREIVSANDPGGHLQAYVQFDAKAGATYYIAVGGLNTNEIGGIRLRVEPHGLPDTLGPIVAVSTPGNGSAVTFERIILTGDAVDPSPSSGLSQVIVRLNNEPVGRIARGTTNWTTGAACNPIHAAHRPE
jgi:subtilisin family serine protease